jgi:hypothetical protein
MYYLKVIDRNQDTNDEHCFSCSSYSVQKRTLSYQSASKRKDEDTHAIGCIVHDAENKIILVSIDNSYTVTLYNNVDVFVMNNNGKTIDSIKNE